MGWNLPVILGLLSIFARQEYQKIRENLTHGHVIVEIDFLTVTVDKKGSVDELVRASLCYIVKSSEIDCYW